MLHCAKKPGMTFNDCASPLSLLLTRRSGKARDMAAPGPSPAQLEAIMAAATRVPDHGKLAPWRYVLIEDRQRFAALVQQLYLAEKPAAGRLELDALDAAARQAPVLIAALSTPKRDCHIPLWEQQLSMGASIMALMLAAHAQGFVANWLTGPATLLAGLPEALGHPGAQVAGFLHIGTATKALEERPRPELGEIFTTF